MIEVTGEMVDAFREAVRGGGDNVDDIRRDGLAAVFAIVERDREPANLPQYEFTQMYCDAWQMHHLANNWHYEYGWEAVAVTPLPAGYKVPKTAGDEDGPDYAAVCPVAVLFRRPLGWTAP